MEDYFYSKEKCALGFSSLLKSAKTQLPSLFTFSYLLPKGNSIHKDQLHNYLIIWMATFPEQNDSIRCSSRVQLMQE